MPSLPQFQQQIPDERDLLERYYTAARSVISEWSGDFYWDTSHLNRQVRDYAAEHGIDASFVEDPQ